MKKRIIAIALVLMMLVAVLPAAAFARSVNYVSINGVALEYFGQTVKCGSGTATLKGSETSPRIVLSNAQITKFENMGSYDGITTYVGIAYYGNAKLEIQLEGRNSITAPSHGANSVYVAVYSNQQTTITGGAIIYDTPQSFLTVSGADIGVEALRDDGSGRDIYFKNAGFSINARQVCVYGGSHIEDFAKSDFISGGGTAIVSDGAVSLSDSTANVSLSPVLKNTDGMVVGISAQGSVGASGMLRQSKLTLNMSVDARGVEGFAVQGISAGRVAASSADVIVNLNVKSDKSGETIGIFCEKDLFSDGKSCIKANLSFSGEHGQACGIITDNIRFVNEIDSKITGAGPQDTALAVMSHIGFDRTTYEEVGMIEFYPPTSGRIYASVDNENTECGAMVHGFDCTDKYGALKIAYPNKGGFALLEDGEDNAYIVKDANGNPAQAVVLTNKDYPFIDIDSSNIVPYKDAILWAVEQGITNGFTPVEFRPNAACTRGQVVTFLWRANGSPEPTITENPFVDVSSSSPYYKAILWAVEKGITNGFDATHFKPSNPCTRAQVVTFLWRAEGAPEHSKVDNPFVDVLATGSTSPYYHAILWAVENGITNGYGANEFRPSVTCNRGQVVTFIFRDMK